MGIYLCELLQHFFRRPAADGTAPLMVCFPRRGDFSRQDRSATDGVFGALVRARVPFLDLTPCLRDADPRQAFVPGAALLSRWERCSRALSVSDRAPRARAEVSRRQAAGVRSDVQRAQRLAAMGISLKHSGHFLVVGSAGFWAARARATSALMGRTARK
jgi:hypothetical protein